MNGFFDIINDPELVIKIQKTLPNLFQIAELECSRAGKVGMEVGSVREKILTALLIYKFGSPNVTTSIPITEPELDVLLFNERISIKTKTGNSNSGVKICWTVDPSAARSFISNYRPNCDILYAKIIWGSQGGLYYIPLSVQEKIFQRRGKEGFLKMPPPNTNPRGVEYQADSLSDMLIDSGTKRIDINWQKTTISYNPFQRWVEYWSSS